MGRNGRCMCNLCASAILMMAGPATAQPVAAPSAASASAPDVPTLGRVEALRPEEAPPLDLYRFRSRVVVEPNRFEKAYDSGISPEEMGLKYGGYINYGINLGLYKSWQGIKRLTGMRNDIQTATARPPPLSEAQLLRATACGQDSACAEN